MVKLILPSYMIGEQDNVDLIEHGNAVIMCDANESVSQTLLNASKRIPNAFSNVIDNSKISKSVIVAYNNSLLKHQDLEKIITKKDDTIEVLTQFAGG